MGLRTFVINLYPQKNNTDGQAAGNACQTPKVSAESWVSEGSTLISLS